MTNFDAQIEELQCKIEILRLEKQISGLKYNNATYNIARTLHKLTCKCNHTDDCSWEYEIEHGKDNWTKDTHKRYLENALVLQYYIDKHDLTIIDMIKIRDHMR